MILDKLLIYTLTIWMLSHTFRYWWNVYRVSELRQTVNVKWKVFYYIASGQRYTDKVIKEANEEFELQYPLAKLPPMGLMITGCNTISFTNCDLRSSTVIDLEVVCDHWRMKLGDKYYKLDKAKLIQMLANE